MCGDFCSFQHHQRYQEAISRVALRGQALEQRFPHNRGAALEEPPPCGLLPLDYALRIQAPSRLLGARAYPPESWKRTARPGIPAPRFQLAGLRCTAIEPSPSKLGAELLEPIAEPEFLLAWDESVPQPQVEAPRLGMPLADEGGCDLAGKLGLMGIFPFLLPDPAPCFATRSKLPPRQPKPLGDVGFGPFARKPAGNLRANAFPSEIPKVFPSQLPISRPQPVFLPMTGESNMAETTTRSLAYRGGLRSGAPKMQLHPLEASAFRQAEALRKRLATSQSALEALDFPLAPEWSHSLRLSYQATGFDFYKAPDPRPSDGNHGGHDVVDVAAIFENEAEPADDARKAVAVLEPIVWDEIEECSADPRPPSALIPPLEIYEPPPAAKSSPGAGVAETPATSVDEQFQAPPIADAIRLGLTALKSCPCEKPPLGLEPLAAATGSRLQLPELVKWPVRPTLVWGPAPPSFASAPEEPAAGAQSDTGAQPGAALDLQEGARQEAADFAERTEPSVHADSAQAESSGALEPTNAAEKLSSAHGASSASRDVVIEEPAELDEGIEAQLAQGMADGCPEAAPAADKAEESTLKPSQETRAQPSPPRPPVEAKTAQIAESSSFAFSSAQLALPASSGGSWKLKAAIAAVVVAASGGFAVWQWKSPSKPAARSVSGIGVGVVETAGIVMGEEGWSSEWALDSGGRKIRQINFYRPSMHVTDYRVEFQAEIEYKSAAWVVRAMNAKNYWLIKLQQVKAGPDTTVRLVRFPVINNEPGPAVEKPLPFPVHVGMVYRVRQDVVGARFSLTIQDKLVDEWTDESLLAGGFGVAHEANERGQIRNIKVWHLRQRASK